MIAHAAPPPPPVVVAAPVVYGRVTVRIGPRTGRLVPIVGGRALGARRVAPGPRRVSVPLPVGRQDVAMRAVGPGGGRTSATVRLWVLPRSAARLGTTSGRVDRRLQASLASLAGRMPAVTGLYVQNLVTGCGAGVNAGARFPAASTLKAAILLDAVRRPMGADAALLDRMVIDSDDAAANRVLAIQGGGDGVRGAARVTETMQRLGMTRSLVRRPYILDEQPRASERIPVTTTAQPALFTNFITTPQELALLMIALHRAPQGAGAVRRMGVGPIRAREQLTRRLLEVRDRSKIVAGVPPGTPVAHKTGYTTEVKHDAGIVYLPAGPIVVSVMTWSASGVSDAAGDPFIARVAAEAVARLGGGGSCR